MRKLLQVLTTRILSGLGTMGAFLALVSGCAEAPVTEPLSDGVLATFVASGDTFKVWITNTAATQEVVAVWMGESDNSIPDGTLLAGPGALEFNTPWAWHFDDEEISMVASASEECDGTPSEVEANLGEWINDKGRFCPSGSRLIYLESL